uniref:Uncharacterized protein n=1 Tax=Zea mays TaxID=4577 RepID=B6U660_MAIZE|nr:hypothetical protein [Zea mays]
MARTSSGPSSSSELSVAPSPAIFPLPPLYFCGAQHSCHRSGCSKRSFFPWPSRRSQQPRCLVSLPSHYAVMLPLPLLFFRTPSTLPTDRFFQLRRTLCDLAASRPGLPWLPPWRTSRSSRDASSRSHVNLLCVTPSACST